VRIYRGGYGVRSYNEKLYFIKGPSVFLAWVIKYEI